MEAGSQEWDTMPESFASDYIDLSLKACLLYHGFNP